MFRNAWQLIVVLVVAWPLLSGASSAADEATDTLPPSPLEPVDPLEVEGDLVMAGSTTLVPLNRALYKRFIAEGYRGIIKNYGVGTGKGFELFAAGKTDIATASRSIKTHEQNLCKLGQRDPLELEVGRDAIVVVVNKENKFIENNNVAMDQLRKIFSFPPQKWSAINPAWPANKIESYIPPPGHGTFDVFVDKVLAGDRSELSKLAGEYDTPPMQLLDEDKFGIGFASYAVFSRNKPLKKKILKIDGFEPNEETTKNGDYPLVRPLILYCDPGVIAAKPQVNAFLNFYLTNVHKELKDLHYFPTTDKLLHKARTNLADTKAKAPIKIGILHSHTGTMALSEQSVAKATRLAIKEINNNQGLLGRLIHIIDADGRSDPDTFAAEARRLIEEDKVCTVFGCWTSASRKTVVPIFEKHDHLLIYPVQYEGLERSKQVIYTGAAPNQQLIPAVKWAMEKGKHRFFLIGSDYVFPRAANEIIKQQLAGRDAEVVGEDYVPLGSDDFQAIVNHIKLTQPDMILNTINGFSNLAFFKALRAAGVRPDKTPTMSFSIGEAELKVMDAKAMAGDYAAWNYFQSIDTPENKDLLDRFRKEYGEHTVVTDPMEAAYIGVKLWARAVEQAGSIETALIREALLRGKAMPAPHGDVKIDPGNQHLFKTPRIGRIRDDGQFEIVWEADTPFPPIPFPSPRTEKEWQQWLDGLFERWGGQWSAPKIETARRAEPASP